MKTLSREGASRAYSRAIALSCMLLSLTLLAFSSSAHAELIYGIAEDSGSATLVTWDSATPNILTSGLAISGLQANESIRGIDFRPATGQLYALGSRSNLYTLDTSSGNVSLVGAGSFTPALNGFSFGFDFNPVIDRIRVVSEVNKNTVLNPNDGTATGVTDVFYAAGDSNAGTDPNIIDSAYTNSVGGATSTQLYGIDSGLDILVTQANSAGTLNTVGPLGVDIGAASGFDISPVTGTAYASVIAAGSSNSTFWTIDLGTGAATSLGQIDGGLRINAIAVAPAIPEPTTFVLGALGLIGLAVGRRRS